MGARDPDRGNSHAIQRRLAYHVLAVAIDPSANFSYALEMVTYSDRKTEVRVGDRVTTRFFFFIREKGTVEYVPGVSPFNKSLEEDGRSQVGIRTDEGSFVGEFVDPEDSFLKTSVTFVERGSANELAAEEDPFGEG